MRDLENTSVVITGASSGIGRATARAFASRGARIALAARRGDLLEEVARECRDLGGKAIAVPTDVADADAVSALAQAAVAAFGRIDVWVNNAGVGVFGPYTAARLALHRRVIETNLFGAMNGAAAVLPLFERQGRGVLINNVSIGGWVPVPFAAAYTASKFALRGFSASLRQEFAGSGIDVCAVFPSAIDTPGFSHGANVSGRALSAGWPVYAPEDVAEAIVDLARRPQGEVAVGWPARAARLGYGLAPGLTERMVGAVLRRYLRRAEPAPRREGALLEPVPEGRGVSGGWREGRLASGRHSGTVGLALAGTALALGTMALSRSPRPRQGRGRVR